MSGFTVPGTPTAASEVTAVSAESAFIDAELRLALYYNGLRDKVAALNVAVVGFSFTVYEKIEGLRTEFFAFLLALGFLSFIAALRSGIAYNYHFNNYERYMEKIPGCPDGYQALFQLNREIYKKEKNTLLLPTLGLSRVPTYVFWSIAIGLICPAVAVLIYHPW